MGGRVPVGIAVGKESIQWEWIGLCLVLKKVFEGHAAFKGGEVGQECVLVWAWYGGYKVKAMAKEKCFCLAECMIAKIDYRLSYIYGVLFSIAKRVLN